MSERFLSDVLREAPRPPRRHPWYLLHAWTIPCGLATGIAAYTLTFGRPLTGIAFAAVAVAVWAIAGRGR